MSTEALSERPSTETLLGAAAETTETAGTTTDTAAEQTQTAETTETAETAAVAEKPTEKAEKPAEITLPEDVDLDPDLLTAFKAGDPQKIADAYLAAQEKGREAYAQEQAKWVEELKADKEFGGAGFDANVKLAQRAVAKFGTPELVTLLNATKLGSHPEVVRLFHRLAKADAEDSLAGTTSTEPKPGREDALRKLYDKSPNLKF